MRKLYVLSTTDSNGVKIYKIGFTKNSVEKRVKQLQTGNHNKIEIEYVYESDDYISSIENRLHSDFKYKLVNGEWFELNNNDVENIPKLCDKYYNMFSLLSEQNTYLQDLNRKFN